ncbi:hypothetical protein BDN72DRAFT_847352 [Pluteus cervinus]|uniref:Uncharacterized protein n=1 Tax=Pluteus cervinus TaxID=181527 RepID=A0ACD3AD64_9AGAR|nr:hypothetical protein BDN72DRAFT_847352 [Pluteus cervinus]
MEASAPVVDLASLPQELLLEILKDCDDKVLYRLAWTCRALHMTALSLLFRKYTDSLNDGRLSLANYPNYLLPAVHGALFVRDLKSIYVHMHNNVGTLYRDLHIIKDLVARSTSLKFFTLNFSMVGQQPTHGHTTSKILCETLKDLMELTIEKGCEWIDIMSDGNIQGVYTPPKVLLLKQIQIIKKERSKKPNFLSALWGKAGSVFRGRDAGEKSPVSAVNPGPTTSKPAEIPVVVASSGSDPVTPSGSVAPVSPDSPEVPASAAEPAPRPESPCRYSNTNLNYISLYSQLFFEDALRDWTLCVLKGPLITSLRIDQDSFLLESWLKALPLIECPSLRYLEYTSVKQKLPVKEFSDFLTRHGPHIRDLILRVSPFLPQAESEGDSESVPTPPPAIDFQNLKMICSDAKTVNWILSAAKAACVDGDEATQCLPKLTQVSFRASRPVRSFNMTATQTEWPELDEALITLSTLASQQVPSENPRKKWLTKMDIECDDASGFKDWANTHISHPTASQLTTLRNIESISFEATHRHFEDSEVALFPQLWAFFPELEEVIVRKIWLDRLKTRGMKYWQDVRKTCPKLRTVKCNWTTYLKVEDLLKGEWPDCVKD